MRTERVICDRCGRETTEPSKGPYVIYRGESRQIADECPHCSPIIAGLLDRVFLRTRAAVAVEARGGSEECAPGLRIEGELRVDGEASEKPAYIEVMDDEHAFVAPAPAYLYEIGASVSCYDSQARVIDGEVVTRVTTGGERWYDVQVGRRRLRRSESAIWITGETPGVKP